MRDLSLNRLLRGLRALARRERHHHVAIIGPIIRYLQEGTVREHGRLDYGWFSGQVAAVRPAPANLRAFLRHDPSRLYELVIVDSQEPELHDTLNLALMEKYDVHAHALVGLQPVPRA